MADRPDECGFGPTLGSRHLSLTDGAAKTLRRAALLACKTASLKSYLSHIIHASPLPTLSTNLPVQRHNSEILDYATAQSLIILVADFLFEPATSGNTKRVSSLVAAIRSWGYKVHFLGLGSNWSDAACRATQAAVDGFEIFEWKADLDPYGLPSPKGFLQRALRWGRRRVSQLFRRWPPALDPDLEQRCPQSFCDFVGNRVEQLRPVAVIAEYLWLSRCLENLPNSVHRMIDSHDLMHQRLLQYRGTGLHSFFQCTLADELKCLRRADRVLVIQEEEKRILSEHLPSAKLVFTPHGHVISAPPVSSRGQRRLIFAGSAHAANVEGLNWFLQEVWPIIAELDSATIFRVVGGCCQTVQEVVLRCPEHSRIQLAGVVDDLTAAFHQSDIMVNPILRGSGLKIKVVEALCCGLGVVSTSKGVEGIDDLEACPSIRVADEPHEFAMAVTALLNHAGDLSEHSLHFANHRFSPDAAYSELRTVLVSCRKDQES